VAFARAKDGSRLYYEVAGGGLDARAVFLVMGLRLRGELWGETRDRFAADGYRVLTMDNRGVGGSRLANDRLTTATMADDAVAVMHAASVRRAHVVGVSLGGMVAQQLALRHPRSVEALVLQSTTAGMRRLDYVPGSGLLPLGAYLRARMGERSADERARAVLRLLTTDVYAERAVLTDPRLQPLLDAVATDESRVGHVAQLRAAWNHRAWDDVQRIGAPTLVQHGAQDRMISVRAGRAIARRIPGARLDVYPRAGHLLGIERPESTDAVRAFLRRCEQAAPVSAVSARSSRRWNQRRRRSGR
jgi:pimeloyl-ACP methyl ester carboxylesterase